MTEKSRYIIGIDLGTTNSAVSFIETDVEKNPGLSAQPFFLPQVSGLGTIVEQSTLPSICYLFNEEEKAVHQEGLPWENVAADYLVGVGALEMGLKKPHQLVQSAKSWLSYRHIGKEEKILPFNPDLGKGRISAVEATTRILRHIRAAWDFRYPQHTMDEQEVVCTVPASFDEVARGLTAKAAQDAGLGKVVLLEEPQAAFYSWIAANKEFAKEHFTEEKSIVVVDVGGGTTDFSIIDVAREGKTFSFSRQAVGRHLLLGGDNMDALLAAKIEQLLLLDDQSAELWPQLCLEARRVKEELLGKGQKTSTAVVMGRGASLVKGAKKCTLDQKEVEHLLVSELFCPVAFTEELQKPSGLRGMGLPYEAEPKITKHLAAFLRQHNCQPDFVLFNGSTFQAPVFQESILHSLRSWFPEKKIASLPGQALDLAVSKGAAFFARAERGIGAKISSGIPRTLYLQLGGELQRAVCVLAKGMEQGSSVTIEKTFFLQPNTPVSFSLLFSDTRLQDKPGDLVVVDQEQMQPFSPIHTVLQYGKKTTEPIEACLQAFYTTLGTVELFLSSVHSSHRWRLEYDPELVVNTGVRQEQTVDAQLLESAKKVLIDLFAAKTDPSTIFSRLEEILEEKRYEWSTAICRSLCRTVLECAESRKRSEAIEQRWWHLVGFLLRPGYGYPLDEHQIKQVWKVFLAEPKNIASQVRLQQCIAWRRIAGGLGTGQQKRLAAHLFPKKNFSSKSSRENYVLQEKIRAISSFERLSIDEKFSMGELILHQLEQKPNQPALSWGLARLAARQMVYGSLHHVIPAKKVHSWVERLLKLPEAVAAYPLALLAQDVDYRGLNLPSHLCKKIVSMIPKEIAESVSSWDPSEQQGRLGDSLPPGIML